MIVTKTYPKANLQAILFFMGKDCTLQLFIAYQLAITPAFLYLKPCLMLFYYVFLQV